MSERLNKHLLDALAAVEEGLEFVADADLARYRSDRLLRAAVERKLTVLGEAASRALKDAPGLREQTPDLKSFGRVDAALLHGTSFESPVFRTVLGVWMQTNPSLEERQRCLSCHAPAVTVFPQHAEKIAEAAGLPLPLTWTELLTLALEDVVVEAPPGHFRRKN